jgi:hypothetical protein
MKLCWKGSKIRTTQPNQRLLQVRCNGKNVVTGGKYTLVLGQKSNEIGLWAKSISQQTITL